MTHDHPDAQSQSLIRRDIAQVRREVMQMHSDMVRALRAIADVLNELHSMQGVELKSTQKLAQVVQAMHRTAPQVHVDMQHCHFCGGPLERHLAQAGQLLLCPSCGWSAFVNRDGQTSNEVQPGDAPTMDRVENWVRRLPG